MRHGSTQDKVRRSAASLSRTTTHLPKSVSDACRAWCKCSQCSCAQSKDPNNSFSAESNAPVAKLEPTKSCGLSLPQYQFAPGRAMIARPRYCRGVNSEIRAIAVGSTSPIDSPTRNRVDMSTIRLCDKAESTDAGTKIIVCA